MDSDVDGGWYEQCLQCGHRSYMPSIVDVNRTSVKKKLKRKKRAAVGANSS